MSTRSPCQQAMVLDETTAHCSLECSLRVSKIVQSQQWVMIVSPPIGRIMKLSLAATVYLVWVYTMDGKIRYFEQTNILGARTPTRIRTLLHTKWPHSQQVSEAGGREPQPRGCWVWASQLTSYSAVGLQVRSNPDRHDTSSSRIRGFSPNADILVRRSMVLCCGRNHELRHTDLYISGVNMDGWKHISVLH